MSSGTKVPEKPDLQREWSQKRQGMGTKDKAGEIYYHGEAVLKDRRRGVATGATDREAMDKAYKKAKEQKKP